ncbi:MAG: ATP-binding cassette domain-containing protein [Oscillospiraceae bacterium]|nr:ATP-binding cassette domain-containing protein [Oscillospiraceae bacterium]
MVGNKVLNHIDLKINRGETVAVMGVTDCGKTSLVKYLFSTITQARLI